MHTKRLTFQSHDSFIHWNAGIVWFWGSSFQSLRKSKVVGHQNYWKLKLDRTMIVTIRLLWIVDIHIICIRKRWRFISDSLLWIRFDEVSKSLDKNDWMNKSEEFKLEPWYLLLLDLASAWDETSHLINEWRNSWRMQNLHLRYKKENLISYLSLNFVFFTKIFNFYHQSLKFV